MGILHHRANALCPLTQWVRAHGGQQRVGRFGGTNGNELAFVGHVERIQPEQFAGGGHLRQHGNVGLTQQHAHLGLACDLIERGGQTAARGVAQHMEQRGVRQCLQHGLHQRVQGGAVGDDGGFELQRLTHRHHRHTMLAQRSRDQHRVTHPRLAPVNAQPRRRYADAGGADEHAVALALFHHLGVASDD